MISISRLRWFSYGSLILVAAACGSDSSDASDSSDPETQAPAPVDACADAPTFSEVTAFQKCLNCHSENNSGAARRGAPAGVNFDTESGALTHADHIEEQVAGRSMPPASSGITLTEEERQTLLDWVRCQ